MCESGKGAAEAILAYLAEKPDAEDTIEGIVEWWLLHERITSQTLHVKKALAELLNAKLIVERKGRDSRSRYSVNRRKLKQIREIVRQRECGGRQRGTER